jgi:hypothetical protein
LKRVELMQAQQDLIATQKLYIENQTRQQNEKDKGSKREELRAQIKFCQDLLNGGNLPETMKEKVTSDLQTSYDKLVALGI